MKKTFIIILLALISCVSVYAQDSKSLYTKYSDEKGVSAVYISPAMFRMLGKIPSLDLGEGDVDITPLVRSLKGFYLLNSENPQVSAAIASEVKKLTGNGKFELMMEAKDDGEVIRMYTAGDDRTVSQFVMVAIDDDEATYISLDGSMDRRELEKMISSSLN